MTNEQFIIFLKMLLEMLSKSIDETRAALPNEALSQIAVWNPFNPAAVSITCPALNPLNDIVSLLEELIDTLSKETKNA